MFFSPEFVRCQRIVSKVQVLPPLLSFHMRSVSYCCTVPMLFSSTVVFISQGCHRPDLQHLHSCIPIFVQCKDLYWSLCFIPFTVIGIWGPFSTSALYLIPICWCHFQLLVVMSVNFPTFIRCCPATVFLFHMLTEIFETRSYLDFLARQKIFLGKVASIQPT